MRAKTLDLHRLFAGHQAATASCMWHVSCSQATAPSCGAHLLDVEGAAAAAAAQSVRLSVAQAKAARALAALAHGETLPAAAGSRCSTLGMQQSSSRAAGAAASRSGGLERRPRPPLLPAAARCGRRPPAVSSAGCCTVWARCRAARGPGPLPSMAGAGMAPPQADGLARRARPSSMPLQQAAGAPGPRRCRPTPPHAPGGPPSTHLHDRQVPERPRQAAGARLGRSRGQQAPQARQCRAGGEPMPRLTAACAPGSDARPICTACGASSAPAAHLPGGALPLPCLPALSQTCRRQSIRDNRICK